MTSTAEWYAAVKKGEWGLITVRVGDTTFPLRQIQRVELERWCDGVRFDGSWLKLRPDGSPKAFIGRDGSINYLMLASSVVMGRYVCVGRYICDA